MEDLRYLQPKLFSFEFKAFQYEGVATHEYFSDADNEIDFTGNYVLILLTPRGTISTVLYPRDEDLFDLQLIDESDPLRDRELGRLILSKVVSQLPSIKK